MTIRLIGIEEHFIGETAAKDATPSSREAQIQGMFPGKGKYLGDLGKERIRRMDQGALSIQVVSHVATIETLETCRSINDQLFRAVEASDGRLRGFATLPMAQPDCTAEELARCIQNLGFVGAQIPNRNNGLFYDGKEHWPMFAKAQELDVPIYIHPGVPTEDEWRHYEGEFPPIATTLLAGPAWGWHLATGEHVLRLYCSGLFDTYPRLKIILGHNGEGLPFMLDRISKFFTNIWSDGTQPKRDWMTVWNENIWVTTSGMFHPGPFQCLLAMCKPDRVLYSLDYPFEEPEEGLRFMESIQNSGLVSENHFEMICHGNAEKLLRLS